MKKLFLILALCVVGIGVSSAVIVKQEQEAGFINVSTSAEEEYSPDVAKVTLSVRTEDKEATSASEKNKETATKVINELKKLIDEGKKERIRTTGFSVNSEYSYQNNKRVFEHYVVQNTVEITIRDMSKVGKIINTGIKNGANSVSGLVYMLDKNDAACDELINTAARAAQTRAELIAKTMNGKVSGVKEVSASCSGNQGNYRNFGVMYSKAMMSDGAVSESAIPTEEGTIKLHANFNGQFYISQ